MHFTVRQTLPVNKRRGLFKYHSTALTCGMVRDFSDYACTPYIAQKCYMLFLSYRRVDETVSHTEEQQVLPTFSQLEEVRRQVDTGVRTMYMFLTYHLKQIAETKKGTEATRVKGVLAEAEDRLR